MRENGAHLSVRADWQRRLITEQQKVLIGQCVAQATPQRFTACGYELDYRVTRSVGPAGIDPAEQLCRYGGYLKERGVRGHSYMVNCGYRDCWRKTDGYIADRSRSVSG